MQEAMFWKPLKNEAVQCQLCPRFCTITNGKKGFCRARKNIGGKLCSLVFGQACTAAIDPIEKKPFYNFRPGTRVFSIATYGCNLACDFCQNWQISQADPEKKLSEDLPPEEVVRQALEAGCEGVAYTYTEPTIFYEYVYETAKLAKKAGLFNCYVSNGMINREPLKKLSKYMDAVNMDLKAFKDDFYKVVCHFPGGIEPVKQTARNCLEFGMHLEITTLLIPGLNDSEQEISDVAAFVRSLPEEVPLHFSRFFPHYKMQNLPPTPVKTVLTAVKIGKKEGLKHVYAGNI